MARIFHRASPAKKATARLVNSRRTNFAYRQFSSHHQTDTRRRYHLGWNGVGWAALLIGILSRDSLSSRPCHSEQREESACSFSFRSPGQEQRLEPVNGARGLLILGGAGGGPLLGGGPGGPRP